MGEIDGKVFSLEAGGVTDPIKSSLGFHLFKVAEREKVSIMPLADVRDKIYEVLFKEKMQTRLENWIKDLKKNAYISIR